MKVHKPVVNYNFEGYIHIEIAQSYYPRCYGWRYSIYRDGAESDVWSIFMEYGMIYREIARDLIECFGIPEAYAKSIVDEYICPLMSERNIRMGYHVSLPINTPCSLIPVHAFYENSVIDDDNVDEEPVYREPLFPQRTAPVKKVVEIDPDSDFCNTHDGKSKNSGSNPRELTRVPVDGDEVIVIYPSGRKVGGRLSIRNNRALIDSTEYGAAAWIMDAAKVSSNIIKINKEDAIRVCHHKPGMQLIEEFR